MGSHLVLMTFRIVLGYTKAESEEQGGQRWQSRTLFLQLLHSVESTACAKPLNLGLVEGLVQENGLLGPVRVPGDIFQGHAGAKSFRPWMVSLSIG